MPSTPPDPITGSPRASPTPTRRPRSHASQAPDEKGFHCIKFTDTANDSATRVNTFVMVPYGGGESLNGYTIDDPDGNGTVDDEDVRKLYEILDKTSDDSVPKVLPQGPRLLRGDGVPDRLRPYRRPRPEGPLVTRHAPSNPCGCLKGCREPTAGPGRPRSALRLYECARCIPRSCGKPGLRPSCAARFDVGRLAGGVMGTAWLSG